MKQFQNDFDQNTLETMMDRYRAELLRYQRATPPGKPTLEQNLLAVSAPPTLSENIAPISEQPRSESEFSEYSPLPEAVLEQDEPPEQYIWEQPAVFAGETESDAIALPPEQPQFFRDDLPPIISLPFEQPAPFACHTEFEKCIGGFGSFKPYERLGAMTCASFLQIPGDPTDVIVRFAADIPFGAAESDRCRRSFSVRFLCRDGQYDMLGSHLPVAVGSDPETFEGCCASMRADPVSGLRGKDCFWRFLTEHTQALSAALLLYSDLGTIGSYRSIDGFSLPCWWVNSKGEKSLVRTRWLSRQRPSTLNRFEAEELAGADPDAVSRDFVNTLKNGEKIQYELAAQIISPKRLTKAFDFDPFDPTCCWCEQQFPLRRLGLLTIDRLPENFAEQILPLKFDSSNLIEGIELPTLIVKDGLASAARYLRTLTELDRKTLISNLTDELSRLPVDLLEKVLILFTDADLSFGRDVTSAMGGI